MNINSINRSLSWLALAGVILMTSCANEAPWSNGDKSDGKIHLLVNADGQVNMSTRADDVASLVPNEDNFSITLKSTDGSYNNTWKNLNAFRGENGFPMGNYIISATFGDIKEEGFKNPYYYGEAPVSVIKGEESSVVITAALANSMFSVRYTDDFKKFFPGYSATVTTEGHEPVVFVQNESRPAYITPGLDAVVKLTLTNSANETVTVSPTKFKAVPRKHYIVTFGVDGNINLGDASLKIEWSEELVSQDKPISLTDELFTTAAPTVTLEGYSNTEPLFEGLEYEGINPEFHIVALGGLTHATLTLSAEEGNGVVPTGFSSIDLVNADANNQSILNSCGIVCNGLYDKVDKFAVVNLKEYLKVLTPGIYTVKIDVEDKFSRSLETPVEFKVQITGLEYNFLTYEKPDFLANEIKVVVETNCEVLKDQLMFKVWNSKEDFVNPISAEFVTAVAPEGYSDTKEFVYTYKLVLPEAIDNYLWKVQTQVPNKKAHEMDVNVNMPEFTVETDVFAKFAKIRFKEGTDPEIIDLVLNKGILYEGTSEVQSNLSAIYSNGLLTIKDLNPKTNYDYTINLGRKIFEGYLHNVNITTEEDKKIPNGDFSVLKNTINIGKINTGGVYTYVRVDYQNYTSIIVNEPEGWASINKKTCYENSTNKNTWFMVPSTIANNEEVLIRSVAYDHEGNGPDPDNHGVIVRQKYCRNYPSSFANYSAGELFLGSYEYNGKETRNEGIEFNSRPKSISFNYTYQPQIVDNIAEQGEIVVEVLDKEKNIIGRGSSLLSRTDFSTFLEVPIIGYEDKFNIKGNFIKVKFISSKSNSPAAPKPTDLNDVNTSTPNAVHWGHEVATNKYKALCTGSELIVSNVSFNY